MSEHKRVTCSLYGLGVQKTTVVEVVPPVFQRGVSEQILDAAKTIEQAMQQSGWRILISTVTEVPQDTYPELFEMLEYGVFKLVGEDVTATQYIERVTPYQWRFERLKSPSESIGRGQLPGHVGYWVKESDRP